MVDYKKMYILMCIAASDSLNILSRDVAGDSVSYVYYLLKQALLEAEEVYVDTADDA